MNKIVKISSKNQNELLKLFTYNFFCQYSNLAKDNDDLRIGKL